MTAAMGPLAQLRVIPDLAAEVFATWGHPNPSGAALVRSRPVDPPAPTDLDTLDALRLDPHGLLFELTQAVRATAEHLRDTGRPWPALTNPPTWASECGWLAATADVWGTDLWLNRFTVGAVDRVHAELSRIAREHVPHVPCLVYGCPGQMEAWDQSADGGWLWVTECEHGHHVDRHEIVRRAQDLQPLTLADMSARVGIPVKTLHRWVKRRILHPVPGVRPRRYRVSDVQVLAVAIRGTRRNASG